MRWTFSLVLVFLFSCNFGFMCVRNNLCSNWCGSPPLYLVFMVLVIGFIIPPHADSLSLNPLRSTLCHAWLTCLRWCQVLAVSRRLPYATVLLSPSMSVKRMSTLAQNTVRHGAHSQKHGDSGKRARARSRIHIPKLYTQINFPYDKCRHSGVQREEWHPVMMSSEDSVACLQEWPGMQLFISSWQDLHWSLKR